MQVGICDDDPQCRCFLKTLLKQGTICSEFMIINEFESLQQLTDYTQKIDILFLDIEVGNDNSLTYLSQTNTLAYNPIIVLVSSHTCYVTQSYDVPVFQFLIKPIQPELLTQVFMECQKQYINMQKHCTVQTEQGIERILPIQQIVCIKSDKQKIFYYATDQKWYYSKENSLANALKQLQYFGFCQIHKSYLVNFAFVIQIKEQAVTIQLGKKLSTLSVGKKYLTDTQQKYLQYMATKGAI